MALDTTPQGLASASNCLSCLDGFQDYAQIYLLAKWAGISPDAQALVTAASGLQGITGAEAGRVINFLLASLSGGSTNPQIVTSSATCFSCTDPISGRVQTWLLANIASQSTDAQTLATASQCLSCIPRGMVPAVEIFLLATKAGVVIDANALAASARSWSATDGIQGRITSTLLSVIGGGLPPPFSSCTTFNDTFIATANFIFLDSISCLYFPNLAGTNRIGISNCANLASVEFGSNLTAFSTNGISINSNPALASIKYDGALTLSSFINCSFNPAMTTVVIGSLSQTGANKTVNFSSNALTQASVDLIIQKCVDGGAINGTLILQGGTNATPSAAGLANKALLVGLGWSVTNN